MRILSLFFLLVPFGMHAGDLWITNDSPFPLLAQVYGGDGVFDQQVVAAGAQWHWTDQQVISGPSTNPNQSVTPYTVIWYCSKGGQPYGTNTNVAVGSWVRAQTSVGQNICPLPKKKTSQRATSKS